MSVFFDWSFNREEQHLGALFKESANRSEAGSLRTSHRNGIDDLVSNVGSRFPAEMGKRESLQVLAKHETAKTSVKVCRFPNK